MELGVSTSCLYPMDTEKALQTVLEIGCHTVEVFVNAPREIAPEFVSDLKKRCDAAEAKICAVHPFTSGLEPFLLFSAYRRRFEDSLTMYDSYCRMAATLGARLIVIHGTRHPYTIPEEEYFERFAQLIAIGERYGIWVAQENVVGFCGDTPDFFVRMKQAFGKKARFVLDVKQSLRCGWTPYNFLDAMGDNICHLHLSDHCGDQTCLLPGKGTFDFAVFFERTKHLNCARIIEVYRDSFADPSELKTALQHLQTVAKRSKYRK